MANSSYLQYLPPVLWVPQNDPSQTLGRHLRIYEKILTGLNGDGIVVRSSAPFVSAGNDTILFASVTDLASFQEGDWITIEGTAERRQVDHFTATTMFLDANLVGVFGAGTVRIADLEPGQTTFRATNAAQLETGRPLRILQAGQSEDLWVAGTSGDFITLAFGLVKTYLMAGTAVPVKLIDPTAVTQGDHTHTDFETQIDDLFKLFNPWRTRTDFLPYLASWLALELRPEWSEYEKRKLISEIVGIYQLRGLKEGIYTYLDIYAVSAAKPRIVVDDNDAVMHAVFSTDGTALLRAMAHSNTVSPPSATPQTVTVLLHPTGIAVDSGNRYFVTDPGSFGYSLPVPRPAALWSIRANGELDYAPGALPLPMPKPIFTGPPLFQPVAAVADATDRISVVDTGNYASAIQQRSGIYRFAPPGYPLAIVIDQITAPVLPVIHPVDMVLDGAGQFIVLDRGVHPLGNPLSGASAPNIVVVSEGPLAVATHALPTLSEPTALIMDPLGRFIVADAQPQATTTPGDLMLVDPAAGWTATSLLSAVAGNPLVFPTGLVWESDSVLLVCDTGLRWGFVADPSNRTMAETPRLFRVDLSKAPPVITQVTKQRQMVRPTRLARDRKGRVLITDAGERPFFAGQRNWRAGANEFGVVVFFSNQRPTTLPDRNLYRRGIVQVVEAQTPGHTTWSIDF